MRSGPWHRAALRGLALLVVLAIVVAGYGAWMSRPRAVAQAPVVLATGAPLPAQSRAPGPAPATASPASAYPGSASPGSAVPSAPAPEVVVHVTGQVGHPGLVRLPAGSRVADAIDAAGGVTRPRAADTVNLARVLSDGEQVVVGAAPVAAGAPATAGSASPAVLDLNSSSAEQLDTLPGVGPVIAGRIVAWRLAHGPFRSVEELGEVSGIGESILAQVRALVRV